MSNVTNENWVSHRWHRDTRYYEAHLKRDLFGWVVVRNWGGIDNRTGRKMTKPVETYIEGLSQLKLIQTIRNKRRYQLVF